MTAMAAATSDDLPIRDYDARTARDIAGRAADLGKRDLLRLRNYEEKHKHRRTVLSQLDYYLELRGRQPKRETPVIRGRQPGRLRGRKRLRHTHLPPGGVTPARRGRASRAAPPRRRGT